MLLAYLSAELATNLYNLPSHAPVRRTFLSFSFRSSKFQTSFLIFKTIFFKNQILFSLPLFFSVFRLLYVKEFLCFRPLNNNKKHCQALSLHSTRFTFNYYSKTFLLKYLQHRPIVKCWLLQSTNNENESTFKLSFKVHYVHHAFNHMTASGVISFSPVRHLSDQNHVFLVFINHFSLIYYKLFITGTND